jgi:AraC-like DNA-binding protein
VVELLMSQRYVASDADSATEAVQAVFGVGTVSVPDDEPFEYVQQSLVDDGISATRVTSTGTGVTVTAVAAPDLVVIAVREGRLRLQQEFGTVALQRGDIGVVCLGSAAELQWDHVAMDMYSFPQASIGRLLGSDVQRLRLRCDRLTPRTEALGRLWLRTAGVLAVEVLQERELFESDIIREQAIDALLAVAIEAFGISDIVEDDVTTDERLLVRADEFMRSRLGEPITIPDVARAVGISLRGLQLMYRRRGQGTPLLHLRVLRMEEAHRALTDTARRPSVGAVARGLSYTNVGRFSAHYREAFGENPADTVRARGAEDAG